MSLSIKRKFFYLLYNVCGKYLPRTYMPYSLGSQHIRYFLVKNFINKCGKNVKIQTNVILSPAIEIGDNVDINENTRIRANVTIGNDVLVAPGVTLVATNHSFESIEQPIREQGEVTGKIVIEDDVWLGTNVIVLPNVIVKRGAIVGAGSVVTKDVDNFSIVAGNPAKLIRKR